MKKIIMIAGGIGSGKAHIMSKKVQEIKETGDSVFMISFADPIKQIVKELYGFDKNAKYVGGEDFNLLDPKLALDRCLSMISSYCYKHTIKSHDYTIRQHQKWLEYFAIAYKAFKDVSISDEEIKNILRFMMQKIGTEIGQSFNKNIWPLIAYKKIRETEADYFVIDDFRFLFEFIKGNEIFQHTEYEIEPYFVDAAIEIRAQRRGISVDELIEQSQHVSEREGQEVIYNFMKLYYPNNIIINNGE